MIIAYVYNVYNIHAGLGYFESPGTECGPGPDDVRRLLQSGRGAGQGRPVRQGQGGPGMVN